MSEQHWVTYNVLGKSHHAGPYPSRDIAEQHRDDIAGFEGVMDVEIVPQLPAKELSRLDRLLEDNMIEEAK